MEKLFLPIYFVSVSDLFLCKPNNYIGK